MVRSSRLCRSTVATAVVLATLAGALPASASQPSHLPSYAHPWFEIGGYHNSRDEDSTGTTGTNRGEATIFAPISGGHRSLTFSQVTAKFFDDTAKEGNLAFGYRKMTPWGFNLGAWVGGDVRRTEIDNTFWQLSGGFEALSKNVDMRLNWYGPVTAPQTGVAGFAQVQLQGNQIFMTGGQEVGLKGIDGEIGFRLPTEYLTINPNLFELRAYAGGYHFYSDDALDNVTGVKGRLELRVNDVIPSLPGSRLTVDYEVSHDDVRDTRHDVGLRMRIPLNGGTPVRALASLTHQQRRMLDGIERDTDIITGRSKRENVEDALTGTDFERVAYATTGNRVSRRSRESGPNSLIILNGTNRQTQTLGANQTLQGGGSTIAVRGLKSGTVLPFTAPGAAGRLARPGTGDNLVLDGSNIHVAGITIVGETGSDDGVSVGDNHRNVFLSDLTILDAGADAVDINDNNQVTIINLTTAGAEFNSIDMDDLNEVTIIGGSLTNDDGSGIWADDENTITVSNLRIILDATLLSGSSATLYGVRVDEFNTVKLNNVTIIGPVSGSGTANVLAQAAQAFNDNTLILSGLYVQGAMGGITLLQSDNTLSLTDATFTGLEYSAITLGVSNNTVSVADSVFNNLVGSTAFWIQGSDHQFTITGSVINNVSGNVFYLIDADASQLSVSNNTFNGPIGGNLFSFETSGTTEVQAGSTGNVNNTGAPPTCDRTGTASFTGEIRFTDGTQVTATSCP